MPADGAPVAGAIHVAPMLAVTDKYFRQLCRLLSTKAVLWTEMVHADAVTHNPVEVLSYGSELQHPVVVQLGGADPGSLAAAARVCAEEFAYDEVNLNCGCPSARVTANQNSSERCFGAHLMLRPGHTGECLRRMAEAVDVPVSVKCRLGVDSCAEYEDLVGFVDEVTAASGVRHVVVHARAALLNGISTAANRRVPPLNYDHVYRLKREFPHLRVTLNGGIEGIDHARSILASGAVDGVMLGRAVQRNPLILSTVDSLLDAGAADESDAGTARWPRGVDMGKVRNAILGYQQYVDAQAAAAHSETAARKVRLKAGRHMGISAVAKAWGRLQAAHADGRGDLAPAVGEEVEEDDSAVPECPLTTSESLNDK